MTASRPSPHLMSHNGAFKHKALILNELAHHKVVRTSPNPPHRTPHLHNALWESSPWLWPFAIHHPGFFSASQNPSPWPLLCHYNDTHTHTNRQHCLRLAVNGEPTQWSAAGCRGGRAVPHAGVLQVQTRGGSPTLNTSCEDHRIWLQDKSLGIINTRKAPIRKQYPEKLHVKIKRKKMCRHS